jgi:hypothetical protein
MEYQDSLDFGHFGRRSEEHEIDHISTH